MEWNVNGLLRGNIKDRTDSYKTALTNGKILKSGTSEELVSDEMVRKLYLGRNFELR